jgi:hypothetical protein
MTTELRWVASAGASCLHAARSLLAGQALVDERLAAALKEPCVLLAEALRALPEHGAGLVEHLLPLSVELASPSELADVALRKALGPSAADAAELARAIGALQRAHADVFPRAVNELELRSGPLIEQWEARGPGLLAGLGRRLGAEVLAPRATVGLVLPAVGGAGEAHPLYNTVTLEAVLANPLDDLPEVVRLAWLIGQLQADLPIRQGLLPRQRACELTAVAVLPAVLAAAADVNLVRDPVEGVGRALAAWRVGAVEADAVVAWWQAYQAKRPRWEVALAALDQLLGSPVS